jgi:hypothetical protein
MEEATTAFDTFCATMKSEQVALFDKLRELKIENGRLKELENENKTLRSLYTNAANERKALSDIINDMEADSLMNNEITADVIVGIIGIQRMGKSFVANKLLNGKLDSTTYISTQKIKERFNTIGQKTVIVLDSVGISYIASNEVNSMNASVNAKSIYNKFLEDSGKPAKESFELVMEVSDIVIMVIEEMSPFEKGILKEIQAKYSTKKFIVIHNYQNAIDEERVQTRIGLDIRTFCKSKATEEKFCYNNDKDVAHYVFVRDETELAKSYNEPAIRQIQKIIETADLPKKQYKSRNAAAS